MFIWCLNSTWQNDKSRKRLIFSAFGISSIECIQINKIQEHRQYKWKRCIIPLHISLLAIMTDSWVKGVKWHIYVWKDWIIMDEIHKRRFRQPLENHREGRNERLVRRLTTQKQAVLLEITPHFFSLKSLFPSQLLLVLLPPFFFFSSGLPEFCHLYKRLCESRNVSPYWSIWISTDFSIDVNTGS